MYELRILIYCNIYKFISLFLYECYFEIAFNFIVLKPKVYFNARVVSKVAKYILYVEMLFRDGANRQKD